MKKTLYVSIAIAALLLIAFFTWFFIGRDKTIPAGEAIADLLPFGSGENLGSGEGTEVELTSEEIDSKIFDESGIPVSDLFRISDVPVAGTVTFARAGQSIVRYVDRATGHVYEVALPQGEAVAPIEKKKITNNTLPKIYEAYFRPDGNSVLLRMLDESETQRNITLNLAATSSAAVNMRGDIGSVAVGQGNTLFFLDKSSKTISSAPFGGSPVRTILNSPFTDWQLESAGSNLIIYTKASAATPGYAYTLNAASGSLGKILGPLRALAVMPDASGTWVFYSYNDGPVRSAGKNLRTGAEAGTSPATLAEKCVWSGKKAGILFCGAPVDDIGGAEPDSWYRGGTNFSDRLWKFDLNQEIAQVLSEPSSAFGIDLDVIKPLLSPSEDYLIFINKRDMTLWAFRLPEV